MPLVSPQRPPHLISSLKGPCGSITDLGGPLQLCTHTQASAHMHRALQQFIYAKPSIIKVWTGPVWPRLSRMLEGAYVHVCVFLR